MRGVLIWGGVLCAVSIPLVAAAGSPLLAWRGPVYIAAGFAGIVGLALMLVQPLLASGALPFLSLRTIRRLHRWSGASLALTVVLHVAGLWITSPPDVIDALLFRSPTPFSAWGVIAMWAVLATALLAGLRRRFAITPRVWRRLHVSLAVVLVCGTFVHAIQIDGTMERVSKVILCGLVVLATLAVALGSRARRGS